MPIYDESAADTLSVEYRDVAIGRKESPGVAADLATLTDAGAALADFDDLVLVDQAVGARSSRVTALDQLQITEVATGFGEEDVLTLLDAAVAQRVWRQVVADALTYGDVGRGGDADDTSGDDLLILQDAAGVVGPVVEVATDLLALVDGALAPGGWQAVSVSSDPAWRVV